MQGILLLDKPVGISSNLALQIVKRLFNASKAGHTGSLDPLASGMLPICLGEATKFSQFLLDADKHYQTVACLGAYTTTGDAEGEIISEMLVPALDIGYIQEVLKGFLGNQQQIPPMYSALKHKGKPLYKLARQGIEIERKARSISILDCQLLHYVRNTLTLYIHCSKGTYIRTLVEDIGKSLGCGAYIQELRRLRVGKFLEKQMVSLELLQKLEFQQRLRYLLPMDSAIQDWPFLALKAKLAKLLYQGQILSLSHTLDPGIVKLYENGQFIGIAEILPDGRVRSKRLMAIPA